MGVNQDVLKQTHQRLAEASHVISEASHTQVKRFIHFLLENPPHGQHVHIEEPCDLRKWTPPTLRSTHRLYHSIAQSELEWSQNGCAQRPAKVPSGGGSPA